MRAPQAVLALVAVTAIAIAVGESSAHGRDPAPARAPGAPNIVVLMTDDETVEYFGRGRLGRSEEVPQLRGEQIGPAR